MMPNLWADHIYEWALGDWWDAFAGCCSFPLGCGNLAFVSLPNPTHNNQAHKAECTVHALSVRPAGSNSSMPVHDLITASPICDPLPHTVFVYFQFNKLFRSQAILRSKDRQGKNFLLNICVNSCKWCINLPNLVTHKNGIDVVRFHLNQIFWFLYLKLCKFNINIRILIQ